MERCDAIFYQISISISTKKMLPNRIVNSGPSLSQLVKLWLVLSGRSSISVWMKIFPCG